MELKHIKPRMYKGVLQFVATSSTEARILHEAEEQELGLADLVIRPSSIEYIEEQSNGGQWMIVKVIGEKKK